MECRRRWHRHVHRTGTERAAGQAIETLHCNVSTITSISTINRKDVLSQCLPTIITRVAASSRHLLDMPKHILSTTDTLNIVADSWCRRNRPESMNTDWGQSLLAYGLLAAV